MIPHHVLVVRVCALLIFVLYIFVYKAHVYRIVYSSYVCVCITIQRLRLSVSESLQGFAAHDMDSDSLHEAQHQ